MVTVKITKTKYIVTFDDNNKQFVYRRVAVARELRVERPTPPPDVSVCDGCVQRCVVFYHCVCFVTQVGLTDTRTA